MEIVLIQVFFFTVLSKQKNKNENENTEYPGTFILFKSQLESKRSFKNFQREDIVHDDNNLNGNILEEKKKIDRLIVKDGVSGLADRSNEFNSFLTVSRKFDR